MSRLFVEEYIFSDQTQDMEEEEEVSPILSALQTHSYHRLDSLQHLLDVEIQDGVNLPPIIICLAQYLSKLTRTSQIHSLVKIIHANSFTIASKREDISYFLTLQATDQYFYE